jgi:hypothetical protein
MRGQFACLYFTGGICKSGQSFALSFAVAFPEKVETKNNVEIIKRGDDMECHGTAEDLIAGEFIYEYQVPGKYARKSSYIRGENSATWTTLRQPDGRLLYPSSTKEAPKPKPSPVEKAEGFKTPEDYREHLLQVIYFSRRCLTLEKPVETKGGHIYTVGAESKEEIKEALSDLYWAVYDAVIHTQVVPTKQSMEQYAKAESDHSFRNFMSELVTGLAKAGNQ